ncbi:Flp family type IVb pilin [Parasphingorhabdus halotolerans]|uniref:Flp family type IVb pilin n=1 Tax=Parasphingorhabdus halotolerans TaxID=2725558 RepID=A0A6H2DJS8_9SPHN|nr:Flp family type IVb pilin [Parasphingorhabdus halotolerans]QJB68932.1 Flp family type IVb pilin [Parasphingorhabdus halotolerans]
MIRFFQKLYLSDEGATAVEYGLILALLTIAVIVAIGDVGDTTGNMWNETANKVSAVQTK